MDKRGIGELVRLAQQGDRGAIGKLFVRYWRPARATAFAVVGDLMAAEDAAADAFQHALATLDSLRDPDRFPSWLRTIVIRRSRMALRRQTVTLDGLQDTPRTTPDFDEALTRTHVSALLSDAIGKLPQAMREAVTLVYFEAYDTAAAAQFLSVPPGTLRRRLHDARSRLRATIEREQTWRRDMHINRDLQMAKIRKLFETGEIYKAGREMLAMRPIPARLVDAFPPPPTDFMHTVVEPLLRPSARATDAAHPIGATATAISDAIPAVTTRLTRAPVRLCDGGVIESVYETVRGSADEAQFRRSAQDLHPSDVLDLSWPATDLRSVEVLLEGLGLTILAGAAVRFSAYDEPRYRAALQLHIEGIATRAASGGVLDSRETAHVRIFLEPWATARTGTPLNPLRAPDAPPATSAS